MVLVVLNWFWQVGLDEEVLVVLGLCLGVDVLVFVCGCNVWVEGVGECLQLIMLVLVWYVVVELGVYVFMLVLFVDLDLMCDSLVVKIEDFVFGILVGNVFELVLCCCEFVVEVVFVVLSDIGMVWLIGLGSGCFVEFVLQFVVEQGWLKLLKELWVRVVVGVVCLLLLDVFE